MTLFPGGAALCLLTLVLAACEASSSSPEAPATTITPRAAVSAPVRHASPTPAATARPPLATVVSPGPIAPLPPASGISHWPIYDAHTHGYDISYPQCGAGASPVGAEFSIIGVNDGKAFTVNPCLGTEWRSGRQPRAVYLNSGFKADNYDHTSAACRQLSQYQPQSTQVAYAIGCSETTFTATTLLAAGAGTTLLIWIDVEDANSWDVDPTLNRVALQAEIDQLAASGRLVGIYSTFSAWHTIVGDWSPNGVVADWLAGTTPDRSCGATGFSGHPIWLVQELATWPGAGYDSDWAC